MSDKKNLNENITTENSQELDTEETITSFGGKISQEANGVKITGIDENIQEDESVEFILGYKCVGGGFW